jgi:hypothetical protein
VEPNLLYYKNRFYDPKLGRFLQTDPIGFDGGMNMYGYVGGDPINSTDPLGLQQDCSGDDCPTILINGTKHLANAAALMQGHGNSGQLLCDPTSCSDVVITASVEVVQDVIVTAPRRRVASTTYTGSRFKCSFYGGSSFNVNVRNLQPFMDGIEVFGESFSTDGFGNVQPVLLSPGSFYGEIQGGHLVPFVNYSFTFDGRASNGRPSFNTVVIPKRDVGPINTSTSIQVTIETTGGSGQCF